MKKLNELSGGAIILFLVMSIPQYLELEQLFKVRLLAFSCLFIGIAIAIDKIKGAKKHRRGYLEG